MDSNTIAESNATTTSSMETTFWLDGVEPWDCSDGVLAGVIILSVMAFCLCLIVGFGLYTYIATERKKDKSKWLEYLTISFVACCMIGIAIRALNAYRFCNVFAEDTRGILFSVGIMFFMYQGVVINILFFLRLLRIFHTTNFELNRGTKICFSILLSSFGVFSAAVAVASFVYQLSGGPESMLTFMYFLAVAWFLQFLGINGSFTWLFLYKLFQTIRNVQGSIARTKGKKGKTKSDRIVGAVTRLSVLYGLSLVASVCSYVPFTLWGEDYDRPYSEWAPYFLATQYFQCWDVFTNFLCIALCYEAFRPAYYTIFGWVDGQCRVCVGKCSKREAHQLKLKSQSSMTSASHSPVSPDSGPVNSDATFELSPQTQAISMETREQEMSSMNLSSTEQTQPLTITKDEATA